MIVHSLLIFAQKSAIVLGLFIESDSFTIKASLYAKPTKRVNGHARSRTAAVYGKAILWGCSGFDSEP